MATIVIVLSPEPVARHPPSYAHDDIPTIDKCRDAPLTSQSFRFGMEFEAQSSDCEKELGLRAVTSIKSGEALASAARFQGARVPIRTSGAALRSSTRERSSTYE